MNSDFMVKPALAVYDGAKLMYPLHCGDPMPFELLIPFHFTGQSNSERTYPSSSLAPFITKGKDCLTNDSALIRRPSLFQT